MTETDFIPGRTDEPIKVGLVLQNTADRSASLLRITHVFTKTLFVMPVSTPAMARYATRPHPHSLAHIQSRIESGELRIGRLRLPTEFLNTDQKQISDGLATQAYSAIAPLIDQYDSEGNLDRARFTTLLRARATELDFSEISLRRLVLRFYYFGRIRSALVPLKTGPDFGSQRPVTSEITEIPSPNETQYKRRGRQPIEAATLGPNTFVVNDLDVADMVKCYETLTNSGSTTYVDAHEAYIDRYFSKRHPQKYVDHLEKKCPLPVTLRQFRSIVKEHAVLSRDIAKSIPSLQKRASRGALVAMGPGEIYEIDATGGRIFLVDSKEPHTVLGTPLIYLLIDRWSRFIVSVYITLRPASWEEIRYALLIAFTSRKQRFGTLGINVDEERWPYGRVCARIVQDRGSEMISKAMLDSAVEGLKIEAETLPPLCPDGKGIVERAIRELKKQMHRRGLKGSFEQRPLDPQSKRRFRQAKTAATYTLREIYWVLIDIVDTYNNSPHKHLASNRALRSARVRPTPRDAYVWGLENITGIESPPLSDADYQRLLLGNDKASLANGRLTYRGRRYLPANAAAERQARLSNSKSQSISIRVDRSCPVEIFAPNGGADWPAWRADAAAMKELGDITLEEEDYLADTHRLLIAETKNDAFINRQIKRRQPTPKAPRNPSVPAHATEDGTRARREIETLEIKRAMRGQGSKAPASPSFVRLPQAGKSITKRWQDIEESERLASVNRQRSRKK